MKLSKSDVAAQVGHFPGWAIAGDAVTRQFTFASFPDAMAFCVRLGFSAEKADHHPDLLISYRKVTVTWSTHDEGGITAKDFDGVRAADTIAGAFGV